MIRVLHLSDLHFGMIRREDGKTVSAHYFIHNPSGTPDPSRLANILTDRSSLARVPPDIVVVSGDLGWSGVSDDYSVALRFLDALRSRWSEAQFVLAPGNHDVDRRASDDSMRQDAFVALLREFHGGSFEKMYPFWRERAPRSRIIGIHEIMTNLGEVIVVAANSAAGLQGASTPVLIDRDCLDQVAHELEKRDPDKQALRLFVLHHHLFPFAEPGRGDHSEPEADVDKPDDTLVANSARLQSWLTRYGFHIVLHGHKHLSHGRYDTLWRSRTGQAAGS